MLHFVRSVVLALVAQTIPGPIILTNVGRQLTPADVQQIQRVAGEFAPGTPWLIQGTTAMIGRTWFVDVFLSPTIERGDVRRGFVVTLRSDLPKDLRDPKTWVYQSGPLEYAQVAVPGRSLNDVRDDMDVNRPFRLFAEFADAELVSVVNFVRSQGAKWTERDLPIGVISRSSLRPQPFPVVLVNLLKNESEGHNLELRNDAGQWSVVEHAQWIR